MDYEFTSQLELFKRVKPALNAKCIEARRLGFSNMKDIDIWNYLIENNWKAGKDLMLSDIVGDIMHCDFNSVNDFVREKKSNGINPVVEDTEELI